MNLIKIQSLNQPGVEVFSRLTEAQLRRGGDGLGLGSGRGTGLFIAESPNVILRALENGFEPKVLLCEEGFLAPGGEVSGLVDAANDGAPSRAVAASSEAGRILSFMGERPIYTGAPELLAGITGYHLTRGAICAFHRPAERSAEDVCRSAASLPGANPASRHLGTGSEIKPETITSPSLPHRIAVLDGIVDAANVGAIFRSAAALGIEAILLTHSSCDPFNRRAIRASMGAVFQLPWTWIDASPDASGGTSGSAIDCHTPEGVSAPGSSSLPATTVATLHALGFRTVAMALRNDSISLDSPVLAAEEHLAIILGNEGQGLPAEEIAASDYVVRIPMAAGVDSLNVAAAAAIAFWQLGPSPKQPVK